MIKFYSRVHKIEHKRQLIRSWKTGKKTEEGGDEVKAEYKDIGWFMLLEGSWEYLYIGDEEPRGFKVGDEVEVTIALKS